MDGWQNAFTTDDSKLWRKGVVWYTFGLITYLDYDGFTEVSEPWFSEEDEQLIKDAMAIIEEQVPCIDFRLSFRYDFSQLVFFDESEKSLMT